MGDVADLGVLDARLSRQLRSWLLHYPSVQLSDELFCHLLTTSRAIINPEVFYPNDITSGRWGNAYKRLVVLDKLGDPDVHLEHDSSRFAYYKGLKGRALDDFVSLVYCLKFDLPFRRSAFDDEHVAALADLLSQYVDDRVAFETKAAERAVVQTLVDIRMPAIRVRTDRTRVSNLRNEIRPLYVSLAGAPGGVAFTFDEFVAANTPADDSLDISPDEAVEFFSDTSALEQLHERVRKYAQRQFTKAAVAADIQAEEDGVAKAISVAGLALGSVKWVQKITFGSGSVGWLKLPTNTWLQSRSSWLFAMRKFNRLVAYQEAG